MLTQAAGIITYYPFRIEQGKTLRFTAGAAFIKDFAGKWPTYYLEESILRYFIPKTMKSHLYVIEYKVKDTDHVEMKNIVWILLGFGLVALAAVLVSAAPHLRVDPANPVSRFVLHQDFKEDATLYLVDSQDGEVWRLRMGDQGASATKYQPDRARWELIREKPPKPRPSK